MKRNHLYRLFIIAALAVAGVGVADAKTVTVTPGALQSLLGDEANTTIALTLHGSINVTDLITISQMEALKDLDMSDVTIESLYADDPVYMSHKSFEANTLPEYIFFTTKVNKVVLPATLTAIGEGAFASSSIKEVSLPATLKSIGDWAFLGCSALTTLQLPPAVSTIGKGAFKQCVALTEMNLAATAITHLPDEAFMGCTKLATVSFPAALESIGEYCFAATALADIVIGPKVETIGEYSLSLIPTLKTADIGTTATLGNGVLAYNNALTTLTKVPGNLPPMALAACPQLVLDTALTATFTHIGDMALAENPTNTYVFSKKLIYVGNRVFDGADNLSTIFVYDLKGNVPQTADSAFYGIKNVDTRNLWVNKEYSTPWEQHPQWSMFHIHRATESVEENLLDADHSITFDMDGTTLVITAQSPLTQVVITDMSGLMIAAMRPDAATARFDLADRQGSIVIIKAATASATRTAKLTIRR